MSGDGRGRGGESGCPGGVGRKDGGPGGGPGGGATGTAVGEGGEDDGREDGGADAVRSALNRARVAAVARGLRPGVPGATSSRRRRVAGQSRRSGAHPDARDPQTIASSVERLVAERGWSAPVAVGGVIGRWDAVVGADTAAHCRPESFADGVLTIRTDSTAWATQLRLLLPALYRRLAEEVGEQTVRRIVVRGPSAPTWRRGPRVAPGSQGPRDTYG